MNKSYRLQFIWLNQSNRINRIEPRLNSKGDAIRHSHSQISQIKELSFFNSLNSNSNALTQFNISYYSINLLSRFISYIISIIKFSAFFYQRKQRISSLLDTSFLNKSHRSSLRRRFDFVISFLSSIRAVREDLKSIIYSNILGVLSFQLYSYKQIVYKQFIASCIIKYTLSEFINRC